MIAPDTIWREARLAIIDCETTGLTDEDRIVELAVVIGERGVVVGQHHWLINPGRPIPEEATAIHKIKDSDVVRAPTFAEAAIEIASAIDGAIPAAYNASFDRRFVTAEWRRASFPVPPPFLAQQEPWIDPYVWARLIQKYAKGKKRLGDVAGRLGLKAAESHRAAADAELALQVLLALARDSRVPGRYGPLLEQQERLAVEQERDFQAWLARQPRRDSART